MRPEKKAIVEQIRNEVSGSMFVILTDYRGLTVVQTEELRNRLHGVKAHVRVVKNCMFRLVARELNYDMDETLKGPSAMIVGEGDVVETAKVIKDFIRDNNLEHKDRIFMEILTPKGLAAAVLAQLPMQYGVPNGEQF